MSTLDCRKTIKAWCKLNNLPYYSNGYHVNLVVRNNYTIFPGNELRLYGLLMAGAVLNSQGKPVFVVFDRPDEYSLAETALETLAWLNGPVARAVTLARAVRETKRTEEPGPRLRHNASKDPEEKLSVEELHDRTARKASARL